MLDLVGLGVVLAVVGPHRALAEAVWLPALDPRRARRPPRRQLGLPAPAGAPLRPDPAARRGRGRGGEHRKRPALDRRLGGQSVTVIACSGTSRPPARRPPRARARPSRPRSRRRSRARRWRRPPGRWPCTVRARRTCCGRPRPSCPPRRPRRHSGCVASYQPGSGPAARRKSGISRSISSTATRISSRARLEPTQRCGPIPNATCLPSRRSRWKRVGVREHGRVAIRRAEQQQHALALRDRLARDLRVARRRAAERGDGRVQAERLLDEVVHERRVGEHGRAMRGLDREMAERRADPEGRVLEARDQQEETEVEDLVLAVGPALDLAAAAGARSGRHGPESRGDRRPAPPGSRGAQSAAARISSEPAPSTRP